MKTEDKRRDLIGRLPVWALPALAGLYWVLDSAVRAFLFQEGGFFQQITAPSGGETWARAVVIALLAIGFGLVRPGWPRSRHADAVPGRGCLSGHEREDPHCRSTDIISYLPDPTLVVDLEGRVIAWNQAMEDLSGAPRDEMLGRGDYEYALPFYGERRPVLVDLVLRPDSEIEKRYPFIERDNDTLVTEVYLPSFKGGRYLWNYARPLYDSAGNVVGAIESVRDVTQRKRAEEAVRKSEELFRGIFDNAAHGIALADTRGRFLEVNRAFASMLGYALEEIRGLTSHDISPPGEMDADRERFSALVQGAVGDYSFRRCFLRKDGSVLWADLSVTGVHDREGRVVAVLSVMVDVTDRVLADQALRESRQMLQLVLDNIPQRVFWKDEDGVYFGCNMNFARDAGAKRPTEIVGKTDWELASREEAEFWRECDRRVVEGGSPEYHILERRRRADGKWVWRDTNKIPLQDAEGNVVGILGTYEDVTDRKKAQEDLEQAMSELKRSNAELEQFAYVASHDLQEPLRMVASYVELLERRYRGKLDPDADDFIAYAVDGAKRMQRLINDLLAYSRVGTRAKDFEPTDSEAVLGQVLTNLSRTTEESGAVVKSAQLPTVVSDDVQLGQLFQNLIVNAIKFRGDKPPRVQISAERKGEEWVFSVRDNGIGIDPKYANRIFMIFQRLHSRGEYPGTGIGLAICKKIAERHGGRIWVESEFGKGATFYFTIPVGGGDREWSARRVPEPV